MAQKPTKFIPNYQLIIDDLLRQIKDRTLPPGAQLPSERELGLIYKVSRQTIRTAVTTLASGGWIESRPSKGSFVKAATPKSKTGKAVPRTSTRQIGVICRNVLLQNELGIGGLLLGLKSVLSSRGYSISFSVESVDSASRLEPVFQNWIKADTMDGYILASSSARIQQLFSTLRFPAVSLGHIWAGADLASVANDTRAIYRRCVEFLARENCVPFCNFIALGTHIEDEVYARESMAGHREGVREADLTDSQARIIRFTDKAYDLVMSIRRALKKHRPRALVLESAKHLDSVMELLIGMGYRVPEDILVVSIFNHRFASPYVPLTASLQYSQNTLPARAGEKLLELIDTGVTEPRQELLDLGEFVLPSFPKENALVHQGVRDSGISDTSGI